MLGYIPHGGLCRSVMRRDRTDRRTITEDERSAGQRRSTWRATLELLSVVAPIYNEEGTIEEFYTRVCRALEGLPFELVLVDDGSSDGSPAMLDRSPTTDPRVRVVYLSRNFGHQTALTAGLDHARGDAVVMLDADLQDPPELIPTMLDHWRAGCDVVYAVREQREGESRFKLATARWFYKLFDKLAQVELQHNSGDFRLLDRAPLDALLSMRERNRFLRGMTVWVGYTPGRGPLPPRSALRRRDEVHVPEDAAVLAGRDLVVLAPAAAAGDAARVRDLDARVHRDPGGGRAADPGLLPPGFGAITIAVLLLGGIQLIAIGIIGEYVGRIYDEVKGRPLYLVRARRNMPEPRGARPAGHDARSCRWGTAPIATLRDEAYRRAGYALEPLRALRRRSLRVGPVVVRVGRAERAGGREHARREDRRERCARGRRRWLVTFRDRRAIAADGARRSPSPRRVVADTGRAVLRRARPWSRRGTRAVRASRAARRDGPRGAAGRSDHRSERPAGRARRWPRVCLTSRLEAFGDGGAITSADAALAERVQSAAPPRAARPRGRARAGTRPTPPGRSPAYERAAGPAAAGRAPRRRFAPVAAGTRTLCTRFRPDPRGLATSRHRTPHEPHPGVPALAAGRVGPDRRVGPVGLT